MSRLHRGTDSRLRDLRWRARPSWRRTARRIIAEHVQELLSRLEEFRGLPVHGVATTPTGIVRTVLPGWAISVTGVAPSAQAALAAATGQDRCFLSASGRYGRFWWIAVDHGPATERRRTVVLGSRLVLTAIEDGRPRVEGPDLNPLLMAS
jgi:hypothetical protein